MRPILFALIAITLGLLPSHALAMLGQTTDDLTVLEDAIQAKLEADPDLKAQMVPMLIAPPKHLWEESRTDFAPAVWTLLKRIWPTPGDLIQCPDCSMQRLHAGSNHTITINSGDLSTADLIALSSDPRYTGVKTVVFTTETASGVEFKLLRIQDGAVLYQYLADGRTNLSDAKPRLGLIKELDRKQRGESLAYVFVDMGFVPTGLLHISFLEQWGSRNQHITGLTLSLLNPTVALGLNYRYMLPFFRRATISGQAFFPLASIASKSNDISSRYAANVAIHCAFSSTFGMFFAVGSSGGASLGISLFNPIWFPFML